MILTSSLQKQINATWVAGAGGGLPDGLTVAADTWYRRFIAAKPDGSTDLFWDTSATAVNFFADANAIAAGFSDSTLFRRYGWTLTDASAEIVPFINSLADPSVYRWVQQIKAIDTTTILAASRTTLDFSLAIPPSCFGDIGFFVEFSSANREILITTLDQDDVGASGNSFTIRTVGGPNADNIKDTWEVDSSSQLFARIDTIGVLNDFIGSVTGWTDPAIIA